MGLNISTLTPASLKSKNVATEEYVDNSIATIPTPDVTGQIQSSEDTFAQSLGFSSYDNMVSNAQLGKTLINGGYINTGLVDADSLKADSAMIKKLLAQNIVMDTSVSESKITSSNGKMVIDFKNGSIYIA